MRHGLVRGLRRLLYPRDALLRLETLSPGIDQSPAGPVLEVLP